MRLTNLTEGVRYGEKQKQFVLSNLKDYKFGFEIEMVMSDHNDSAYYNLEEYPISHYVLEILNDRGDKVGSQDYGDLANVIATVVSIDDMIDKLEYTMVNDLEIMELNYKKLVELQDITDINPDQLDMFSVEQSHAFIGELVELIGGDKLRSLMNKDGINFTQALYLIAKNNVEEVIENPDDIRMDYIVKFRDSVNAFSVPMAKLIQSNPLMVDFDTFPSFDSLSNDDKSEIDDWWNNNTSSIVTVHNALVELLEHPIMVEGFSFSKDDVSDGEIVETMMNYRVEPGSTIKEICDSLGISDSYEDVVKECVAQDVIVDDLIDEIEGNSTESESSLDPDSFLYDFDIDTHGLDIEVKPEGSTQVELISDPLSGNDIITGYKAMKSMIEQLTDKGFTAQDISGLHMSISYKKSNHFDTLKMNVLSGIYELTKKDETMVREWVDDVFENLDWGKMYDIIESMVDSNPSTYSLAKTIIDDMKINTHSVRHRKYSGINYQGLFTQGGRVELRFFGGEDYNEKVDEYFDILIKFMYVLKIVADDDGYDKEYYKDMFKITNAAFKKQMDIGILEAYSNIKMCNTILHKMNMVASDHRELIDDLESYSQLEKEYDVMVQQRPKPVASRNKFQYWIYPEMIDILKKYYRLKNKS